MRPLDFYRLGVSLAQTAGTESEQRTVVNRLYYGLHHEACCRYFRANAVSVPLDTNRRHTELRDRFNARDDSRARTVGNLLNDMMAFRREADYELVLPLRFKSQPRAPHEILDLALQTGRELLHALEEFSPGEAEYGCRCPHAYVSR